jgi:rhodanese-related sulfurtransferase
MNRVIIAVLAAIILTPIVLAAGQETSPDYMTKADDFVKSLTDNGYFLMPMSDLINMTENETEMANWVVLDVRPEPRYALGHIAGAINVPFTDIIEKMETVPSDKKLAVVCGIDTNSAIVVAMLRVFGDRDAWIVEGGTPGWLKAGKEFVL